MAARQTITGFARRGAPRGFTLIELLVVMGIIVVMAAFAVPTYHFIMGNRSLGAAENMIAAMVGRARSQAIGNQRYAGVAFFYNPATGRSSMAIVVERAPGSVGEEDPYLNYRGWSNVQWNSNSAPQYLAGQEVYDSQIDQAEKRVLFRRFHALHKHTASDSTRPAPVDPPGDNSYWRVMTNNNATFMDFVAEGEIQPLPPGVGVQLINDPDLKKSDRYVRTGVILFDAEGRLVSKDITIDRNGELGRVINDTPLGVDNNGSDVPGNTANDLYRSQLGLVLYDQETFKSQDFTEADLIAPVGPDSGSSNFNATNEGKEEEWLDQNAMQLLFSRHTGTVLRGE